MLRSARVLIAAITMSVTGALTGGVPAQATIPLTGCQSTWNSVAIPSPGANQFPEGMTANAPDDVWTVGYVRTTVGGTPQTLAEHWTGSAWTAVPTANVGTGDNYLFGVTSVSKTSVWAVGHYLKTASSQYQTLIEHWDGASWTVVPSPNTGSLSNFLFGAVAVADNDVWAVGAYEVPLIGGSIRQTLVVHWNGASWSIFPSPDVSAGSAGNSLIAATAVSANDVWAVGWSQLSPTGASQTLIEHWDGANWTITPTPANPPGVNGNVYLSSVARASSTDVWAVGPADQALGASSAQSTLAMHWNGSAWAIAPSQDVTTDDTFIAVAAAPGGNAWALGESTTSATTLQTLVEKWNGTSFSAVASPNPSSNINQFNAAVAISQNDVWGVGVSGVSGSFQSLAEQYCVPAVVSSINPKTGSAAGGTSVTVSGTGFLGAIGVSFGAAPAVSFDVISDTQITAVSPPQAPGVVDMTVTTAATSAASSADQFIVTPVFPGQYTPLPPFRILDTRNGTGGFSTLGAGQSIDVQIAGVAQSGVPAMNSTTPPSAVVLNVTVTNPTAGGYLTLYPTGVSRPLASNLNFVPGQTVPNLVEVALGTGGKVTVFNSTGSSDVIFDVAGWISTQGTVTGTAGLFRPLVPARVLDTRSGLGGSHTMTAGQTINLQVTGAGNVPLTGVSGVVLNVTATGPTASGFLTVFPAGASQPLASNVNFTSGQTVPNRVMVKLGTGGAVSIFNAAGSVDVVVDVGGWFTDGSDTTATGGLFTGLTPARILDTRNGTGGFNAALGPNGTIKFQVAGQSGVPAMNATVPPKAVVLNVTVTNTTAPSFLTVFPSDAVTQPLASDLNWTAGKTVPNLVVVKLGADGKVAVYNGAGSTDVIADVVGWYS